MSAIASLLTADRSLEVTWADGVVTRYPWIWLRDNAHDADTLHPVTQQRQVFTASLPTDLAATAANVVGDALVVQWADLRGGAAESVLPVAFLSSHRVPQPARAAVPNR